MTDVLILGLVFQGIGLVISSGVFMRTFGSV